VQPDNDVTGAAGAVIRTAQAGDEPSLFAIERFLSPCQRMARGDGAGAPPHRLDIPHGDDYFCLVAELDGRVVGYLSAGGSRDDDHKSYGELYELAVDPLTAGPEVVHALAHAGIGRLIDARYGGVIVWVTSDDAPLTETVIALGLLPDPRSSTVPSPARSTPTPRRRYGMVLDSARAR
jgi:hypothetical protein